MDISLASRILFTIGPIQITDSLLGAFIVSLVLMIWGVLVGISFHVVPTRTQMALETIAHYLISSLKIAFGSTKEAYQHLSLIFTLLLYIAIANQFSLLPLVFEITYEGGDVLRQPTSDFGATIALALLVIGISHVIAFRISPLHHIRNFFPYHKLFEIRSFGDLMNAGIDFFIGILNVIGEFSKVVSLAARLFGNIFAGNVMAMVIAGLVPFVLPIPFLAISIFSGFVQAFVFMLLSMQFIAGTVNGARPQPVLAS